MKQRKQKQSRRLLFRLFLLICIVVGLLIALYPFYVDSLNSLMDQKRVSFIFIDMYRRRVTNRFVSILCGFFK